MLYKSLIHGVLFSIGVFAGKSGIGLAYLLERTPSWQGKALRLLGFALLYALVFALPGWGFGAFLVSNVAWLIASAWQRQWPLHAQQWVFLACSLLGLWNWWLGPLLLG